MAAVVLSDIKDAILSKTGKTNIVAMAGPQVVRCIQASIRLLDGRRFWFLENNTTLQLLATSTSVQLPADFKNFVNLQVGINGYWVGPECGFQHMTYQQLQEEYTSMTATGAPEAWAEFGGYVYASRIADQDYTLKLDYTCGDTNIPSGDGDSSVWFDEGRDLIEFSALSMYYRDYLHNEERAAAAAAQAKDFLSALTIRNNIRNSKNRLS